MDIQFDAVYYEPQALEYPLGQELQIEHAYPVFCMIIHIE